MFCPRCGAESDEGSRYCAACGSELPRRADSGAGSGEEAPGFRERLRDAVGTSRRSRMLSLGTAAAIVIAVVAFVALPSDDDGEEAQQDGYARALDGICTERKQEVAAAQRKAVAGRSLDAVGRYADSLVPIVGEWRRDLANPAPPGDRAAELEALQSALLEVQIEAGTLARVAREGDREGVATTAVRVDAATENVEAAVDSLGLRRCSSF